MKNSDAKDLFLRKERKVLQGRNNRNLRNLFLLFFVAIMGISFGFASMKYLRHKMEDRYVSCLDVVVDQIYGNGYSALSDFLTRDGMLGQFGIDGIENVYLVSGHKFYPSEGFPQQLDGRSCHADSPIMNSTILASDNVIKKRNQPLSDNEMAIIISQEGLKKLKLEDPTFLKRFVDLGDEQVSFDVPVYAIVKELPDMCDFLATEGYIKQDISDGCDHYDVSQPRYNKQLMLCCSAVDVDKVMNSLGTESGKAQRGEYLSSWDEEQDYKLITLPIFGDSVRRIADSIAAHALAMDGVYRIYSFNSDTLEINPNNHKPSSVSCYFQRAGLQENVEKFRDELKKETNYSIDMGKINNLKNLAYVQYMCYALSFCIIVLAFLFICIFVSFLLNTHFQKIQRNLGTFKAFGMKNKDLESIYTRLLIELILSAFAAAGVIALVVTLILRIFWTIEPGYYWFNILAWPNLVLLLVAIASAYLTTKRVSHTLLSATPGDLIYDRIDDDNRKK